MREGLVRVGHPMRILPPLHCDAAVVGGIEEFPRKPLFHRVFRPSARTRYQPSYGERLAAVRAHLDRHLVSGTADAARGYFDSRAYISQRVMEDTDRVLAAALGDAVEGAVDVPLSNRFLTFVHQAVHEFGQHSVAKLGVRQDLAFDCGAAARHGDLLNAGAWRRISSA